MTSRQCTASVFFMMLSLAATEAATTATPANNPLEGEFLADTDQLQSASSLLQKSKGEWVFAPIPSQSPSQGWGLQLVGGRIFRPAGAQASTPPSVLGLVAFYSENQSFALGAGYRGHLADDRWRVMVGGGYLLVNSDYYGVDNSLGQFGLSIPIEQKAAVGLVQVTRRLRPGLYAGLRTLAAQTQITVHGPLIPPIQLPDLVMEVTMQSAGPVLQWDTRDNTFAPTRGTLLDARMDYYVGDFDFHSGQVALNHYRELGEHRVLALRGYAQQVSGEAPFFALCSFGQGSDLRGYISGKYRDRAMVAVQAEYRHSLGQRWGFVLFAGAGQVADSLSALSTDRLLSSAGGGVRFRLTATNPVNLRCDLAWGRDGRAFYLGVGEAF